MTKKQRQDAEFDGFMQAKRQITGALESRIDVLEKRVKEHRLTWELRASIEELESIRNYIRNVALYFRDPAKKRS